MIPPVFPNRSFLFVSYVAERPSASSIDFIFHNDNEQSYSLSQIVAQGVCKPYCTRTMLGKSGAVKVYSAALHAHFLGKTLSLAQYRNGTFLRYLAKDDVFSYNNPTSTVFSPSVELRPGDELKTTCKYDTRTKKETTYYGDGTYDEMCFGFIKYYPKIKAQSLCIGYER